MFYLCFFFTEPELPDIHNLSLHDALPISSTRRLPSVEVSVAARYDFSPLLDRVGAPIRDMTPPYVTIASEEDRKSTRLNSSHVERSYAVFCLKNKKTSI